MFLRSIGTALILSAGLFFSFSSYADTSNEFDSSATNSTDPDWAVIQCVKGGFSISVYNNLPFYENTNFFCTNGSEYFRDFRFAKPLSWVVMSGNFTGQISCTVGRVLQETVHAYCE